MKNRLILPGLMFVCALAKAGELTTCNSLAYGPNQMFTNTSCFTKELRQKPRKFFSPSGILHTRSRTGETYCYLNDYGKSRCMNTIDVKKLVCGEIEGAVYCVVVNLAGRKPPSFQ